ncbi:MAG: glycosyltransferase, partial [Bacteroidales bacterium]|nr:glycosyltransferase [Bacteroidales bacterium]
MVSIIIVNYNTFEITCQCIQSIYEKTKNIDYEIIVVDNNS